MQTSAPRDKLSDVDKDIGRFLSDEVDQTDASFRRGISELEAIRRRVASLTGKNKAVNESITEMWVVLINCGINYLFGFYLTVWGFMEWGRMIQRPRDELLRIQLEQAKIALAKAKAEVEVPAETSAVPPASQPGAGPPTETQKAH